MRLTEGRRVKLVADLRLADEVTLAVDSPDSADATGSAEPEESAEGTGPAGVPAAGAVAGFLALTAGTEGTVERVDTHERVQSHGAAEYERLGSLLADFGHQMPPVSKQQLEDRIAALEPQWRAYEEQQVRVTVRVRFDNGFVLDGADQAVFTAV